MEEGQHCTLVWLQVINILVITLRDQALSWIVKEANWHQILTLYKRNDNGIKTEEELWQVQMLQDCISLQIKSTAILIDVVQHSLQVNLKPFSNNSNHNIQWELLLRFHKETRYNLDYSNESQQRNKLKYPLLTLEVMRHHSILANTSITKTHHRH